MQTREAKAQTRLTESGYSVIELVVTITIITLVTGFATIGIVRARASTRLSGAAREFASYIEKARVDSIRRHADAVGQAASIAINPDRTSYVATMDFNGDGTMDTRTIPLPDGVTFQTEETIAFDWRGRTWNTVGGVTTSHAQVSITLTNSTDSVSVDVTGSGDVTIDSRVFDDSVPDVNLNVPDLGSAATPGPSATPTPSGSPSATPTPGVSPSPTPNPSPTSTPYPTPTPISPTPTPTPAPTPTPSITPAPTPTPTPIVPCSIAATPDPVTMSQDGTATIRVSHNGSATVDITASSSKPSDLQVTPTGAQTVSPGGSFTFTIKSKRSTGIYSVTLSAGCGQTVVPVTVL